MTDKREVKRKIKQLQHVKTWQLLLLLMLMVLISATFLRLNNVGMVERRTAVLDADKSGNLEDIEYRLYDLQRYSSEHMNADSGVVYLSDQYNRDSRKIIEASSASDPNANVYKKAAEACDPHYGSFSQLYLQCFISEISKYPAGSNQTPNIVLPAKELYRYHFISPLWSPDFAGFSTLISLLVALVIVIRLVTLGVLKLLLRRHYQSI